MPTTETSDALRVEQRLYARLLERSAATGFAVLVAGFAAYAFGWLPAHVPLERLPELWGLPLRDYLRATDAPRGWGWIAHLADGEFASLAGIALLAGASLLCLGGLLAVYARRGDRFYAAICVAEIAVMLLAASGVLTTGH